MKEEGRERGEEERQGVREVKDSGRGGDEREEKRAKEIEESHQEKTRGK